MILLSHQIERRTVAVITYQPALRPALPHVYGPLDYREQRALFERIDLILSASGLEQDFINLALVDRKIDTDATSAKRLESFARFSVLALRSNIARKLTGLAHREFSARLADSPLLQWFLHVKADIHFPIDWVLLRDAARTLMKATALIRKHGLKNRMPQEPLDFLSEMNTLCMKMTAKRNAVDSRKQRKKVLREMKTLEKCIGGQLSCQCYRCLL